MDGSGSRLWPASGVRTALAAAVVVLTFTGMVSAVAAAARPTVTAKITSPTVRRGDSVRVTGRVQGLAKRPRIVVQERAGRSWRTVRRTRADGRGLYSATVRVDRVGRLTFRVRALAKGRSVTRRLRLTVIERPAAPNVPPPVTPTPAASPPAPPPTAPTPTATPTPTQTPTPSRDFDLDANPATVRVGSEEIVPVPEPLERLTSVTQIDAGGAEGIGARVEGDALVVSAAATAAPGSVSLRVRGQGCTDVGCDRGVALNIPLTVSPVAASPGALESFTSVSPDRVQAAEPLAGGGFTLTDELLIVLGTADKPGGRSAANAAAGAVDGVVSGGLDDLGIYEVRWTSPQNLALRQSQLAAQPGVSDVSESAGGLVTTLALPPGDWNDDTSSATWPFWQIRAPQAWDLTTGGDVTVGVVDEGAVFVGHEDLNVTAKLTGDRAAHHATHVAGLACGKANGLGLVGAAWGCPIVTAGLGAFSTYEQLDKQVLAAAERTAKAPNVKVINMSLGYVKVGCASAAYQDGLHAEAMKRKALFRRLFEGLGRGIVWTISAGNNCAPGVPSPWGKNADLPNVITVAATNSDRSLASFSDFGPDVEVAAPGGQGLGADASPGIWSSSVKACGAFGWSTCSDYKPEYGTSMSAPLVAGVVALVRSKHPDFGAVEAAQCVTNAAGHEVGFAIESSPYPAVNREIAFRGPGIPIVNARAAVECRADVRAVRPTTPTTGPAGYEPGIAGPACVVGPGEEPVLEESADGTPINTRFSPAYGTGPWTSTTSLADYVEPGLHRVSYRCVATTYDPYEQREVWRTSGFDVTLTGPYRPVTLAPGAVAPGGSVSFISGASAGPQQCPVIHGEAARALSLTLYGADVTQSLRTVNLPTATTQETLAVPADAVPGATLYARARCHYGFADVHTAFAFDFQTIPVAVN